MHFFSVSPSDPVDVELFDTIGDQFDVVRGNVKITKVFRIHHLCKLQRLTPSLRAQTAPREFLHV